MNIINIILFCTLSLSAFLTLIFVGVTFKKRFYEIQDKNAEEIDQIEKLKKDDVSLFVGDIENE